MTHTTSLPSKTSCMTSRWRRRKSGSRKTRCRRSSMLSMRMGTNLLYRGSPSGVAKLIMRDELQDGTSKPNGLARLDNLCRHSYSEAMEVHLSSDQLTKLANL